MPAILLRRSPTPTQQHARLDIVLLLVCAGTLALLYAVDTLLLRPTAPGALWVLGGCVLLLLAPMTAALQGRGRSGFWYALISIAFVTHALLLAVADTTRVYGVILLAASLTLFVVACAFARRRGLSAD